MPRGSRQRTYDGEKSWQTPSAIRSARHQNKKGADAIATPFPPRKTVKHEKLWLRSVRQADDRATTSFLVPSRQLHPPLRRPLAAARRKVRLRGPCRIHGGHRATGFLLPYSRYEPGSSRPKPERQRPQELPGDGSEAKEGIRERADQGCKRPWQPPRWSKRKNKNAGHDQGQRSLAKYTARLSFNPLSYFQSSLQIEKNPQARRRTEKGDVVTVITPLFTNAKNRQLCAAGALTLGPRARQVIAGWTGAPAWCGRKVKLTLRPYWSTAKPATRCDSSRGRRL